MQSTSINRVCSSILHAENEENPRAPSSCPVAWAACCRSVLAYKQNAIIMTTITPMKKFLVKRTIPGAGSMTPAQLNEAGCGSRKLNDELGCKCVWINSFVVPNGTYCIYAAYSKEDVEQPSVSRLMKAMKSRRLLAHLM